MNHDEKDAVDTVETSDIQQEEDNNEDENHVEWAGFI